MIRKALWQDLNALTDMATALWPEAEAEELFETFKKMIFHEECAVFLYFVGQIPVGFAQCQLRRDYVEGTRSCPVGYLEAVFVRETYRRRGIASGLVARCEEWAKKQGCSEFASDCEVQNQQSFLFHQKIGFAEVNRIICFTKKL